MLNFLKKIGKFLMWVGIVTTILAVIVFVGIKIYQFVENWFEGAYQAGYRAGQKNVGKQPENFNFSPSTLVFNYPETLFVAFWRGEVKEGDQIEISVGKQKLTGISVKSQEDEGNIIISSAAGFLEVPPKSSEIKKWLSPGRYDVVVKQNGREIARLEKAVQVLPNAYAVPVPNKFKVAITFLFVIGIIGVALYFIIFQSKKKKPASTTTPTPATPPTVTP